MEAMKDKALAPNEQQGKAGKMENKSEPINNEEDDCNIQTAPPNAPFGKLQLLFGLMILVISLVLRERNYGFKVAGFGCVASTMMTIYYKLKLRPTSTYLLCGLSVVLNSIAFGHMFSPMMATGVSSVVAAIQAFLSLPFTITSTTKRNK